MECYSPTKMNELLIQTTAKMNFNIIMQVEEQNINIENSKNEFHNNYAKKQEKHVSTT